MILRVIRYTIMFFVGCAVQFGLIPVMPFPFNATPLLLTIGVYLIITLRPNTGLLWLLVSSFITTLLSATGGLIIFLSGFIGIGLALLLQQVFTHRSIYAATSALLITLLVWHTTLGIASILLTPNATHNPWFPEVIWSMLSGSVILWILLLVVPRLSQAIRSRVLFST